MFGRLFRLSDDDKKLGKAILLAISIIAINKLVLFPYVVSGSSMYPTKTDGQFGVASRIICELGRFDIVAIKSDDQRYIVKRVIGLPNEKIEYKDSKLYVNDEFVEESFISDVTTEDFVVQLQDDEYFCLGDNRNNSLDSRAYGPFSRSQIKAKMFGKE